MAKGSLENALHQIHRIVDVDPLRDCDDHDLLDRFARQRDESAFVLLVRRHGPLVCGVCRRILRHEQDAEDAVQATFLVLARRAAAIHKKTSLASWLYKVALRIAWRAKNKPKALTNRADLDHAAACDDPRAAAVQSELREMLDAEIARLPDRYARAIVLCFLQGKTHEEAARLLGCPKGTLAAWVARGRERLCKRLASRGCALSAAGLTAACAEFADAAVVSTESAGKIAHASLAYLSGEAISPHVVLLAEGALRMIWFNKIKMIAGFCLLTLALTAGGGWLVKIALADGPSQEGPVAAKKAEPPTKQDAEIAKLRAEIAQLREQLHVTVEELKNLRESIRADKATYKGKPASYWLNQFEDADPQFRADALDAIAALARKDRKLAQVLLSTLKNDPDEWYQDRAARLLNDFGPEVLPGLIEIAKDEKASVGARIYATEAIGRTGKRAKPAIPALIANLGEKSPRLLRVTVDALGRIGPDAKEALPALVEALGVCLKDIEKHDQPESRFGTSNRAANYAILDAIEHIQPDTPSRLPPPPVLKASGRIIDISESLRERTEFVLPKEYIDAWRKTHEALVKMYGNAK